MMDKVGDETDEKILKLSLEIIHLLTKEEYMFVKKHGESVRHNATQSLDWPCRSQSPIIDPPSHSLICKRKNGEKILELTNAIIRVLTGKVPIWCEDVAIYLSMEEWKYLEGHRDLYKDVIEDHQIKDVIMEDHHAKDILMGDHQINDAMEDHQAMDVMMEDHQPLSTLDDSVSKSTMKNVQPSAPLSDDDLKMEKKDEPRLEEESLVMNKLEEKGKTGQNEGEEPNPCEDETDSDIYDHMGQTQRECSSLDIKEEPAVWQDRHTDINTYTEYAIPHVENEQTMNEEEQPAVMDSCTSTEYLVALIKEEVDFCKDLTFTDIDTTVQYAQVENRFTHVKEDTVLWKERDHSKAGMYGAMEPRCTNSNEASPTLVRDLSSTAVDHTKTKYGFMDMKDHVACEDGNLNEDQFSKATEPSQFLGVPFTNEYDVRAFHGVNEGLQCKDLFTENLETAGHQKGHTESLTSLSKKTFYSKSTLGRHYCAHTGRELYWCSECDNSNVIVHQWAHTGEKPYPCPKCAKCFDEKGSLHLHMKRHNGEKPYYCVECGQGFVDKASLAIHNRSHTGEKPYNCSECGKCFDQKRSLITHMNIHQGKNPFSCPDCERCFTDKTTLNVHQRIHTGEKPFSCPECQKCFRHRSNLIVHLRVHTGEKPYICSECGKGFKDKSKLNTHHRIHTGEKPFSCPACGKCFSQRGTLLTHMKVHSGKKPFSCPDCGKCFTEKTTLKIHLRGHTGEKPFSCSECGKCFTDKSNLNVHQRSHTGEKPFTCPECGKCFTCKSNLGRHLMMHVKLKPAIGQG